MKFLKVAFVALALIPRLGVADFNAAIAAMEKRDYATAFREFKALADVGDKIGQINLAALYVDGLGTPKDFDSAAKLAKPWAEQGDSMAQMLLGRIHQQGYAPMADGRPNITMAVYWYELSAKQGFIFSQGELGRIFNLGSGVPRDFKRSVYWLCQAIRQGDSFARGELSRAVQTEMRVNRSGFNADDATCK